MSEGLEKKVRDFISLPVTQAEVQRNFDGFSAIANFPRVFGVVDCTHIKLANAGGEKPQNFVNSAGWFSMNVQVTEVLGSNLLTELIW